ncbi:MAG TPA: substrate-binding domain-containing protein [candidate division Zixibacteria bacterium]|nr:substrate-binding domain-containing protein [candidate division Zixibacteria bacterium]
MSQRLKKLLILSICMLPLLLTFFCQVSDVNANSPAINKDASTGIGISAVDQSNWPDWLNWTIPEDINLDGKVSLGDLVVLAHAYGSKSGDPNWNSAADINNDGKVSLADLVSLGVHYGYAGSTPSHTTLTVSSTTSLYETGVEDQMKTEFQAQFPWITINFLSQGTGAALQTATRGDADMIMVHAPSSEQPFLTGGYGVNRKIIASNFFIMVGPQNDTAGITGMTPVAALKLIKTLGEQGRAIWISRGDASGTNTKEIALWKAAGINYTQISTETSWFKSTGQGMTPTLLVANELGGYTLSDTASYLTNTKNGNIQMKVVVQATQDLLNVYSVIADNPLNANLTKTNFAASMLFIYWLVSSAGQNVLANYGTSTFGAPLFAPFVPLVSTGSNATLLSWIQSYAYIPSNATECPSTYRYDAGSLYSNSWDPP